MDKEELVLRLLRQWEDALRGGRQIPLAELCADHPDLVDDVQRRIAALTIEKVNLLETMDHAAPPTQSPATSSSAVRHGPSSPGG